MLTDVPEQGQLVDVRRHRYVVLEVQKSALPQDGSLLASVKPQHLVRLSSVEDDGIGEEAEVLWELEPGARVYEKAMLPDISGFDAPERLDAFLDAIRWGAVASADPRSLQSPFRSGIDIQDYQLDPVVRALRMPRANLLIADDVGLGKTIEAGLVVQELLVRHRARTVLIVCPSSIQIQWKEEMRDKFGLEFRIVDSVLMKELRRSRGIHVNPWTHFPRLITSIDYLKRERPMRLFREELPAEGESVFPRRFDLLIVDEAHNVAPSGTGKYATDSQRTRAIRTLAPHFEHKLFLTATPHNGYPESFTALLELLDNQRFARGVRPDRDQLAAVMVRRMKSELKNFEGAPRFPKRCLEALEVDYTERERQAHEALQRYSVLRQKAVEDETEKTATDFVLKMLKKRLFSSPFAFQSTLERHQQSLRTSKRTTARASKPTAGLLRRQIEGIEEEFADDDCAEESIADIVETTTRLFREPSAEEEQLLRELKRYAEEASAPGRDSKANRLIKWLRETLKPDGQWNDTRVLIFTEYRATQKWLHGLLAAQGFAQGGRLLTMYGGMLPDERERIKAAFQADPKLSEVRILLATDAASEGINLQNHCSRLIHYEIPWNPNRMEQRNGRLDRHGQRAPEVQVYHFVGKGYAERAEKANVKPGSLVDDLEFLMRAAIKVNAIREDLGKVGSVIADQVEQAMLGRRSVLDTSDAESKAEPVRRMLRFERRLEEQIQKLHEQLRETRRELALTPENICAVVQVGLALAGQPPLREATLPGVWPDTEGRRKTCPVFEMPALGGSWAECTKGLAHPHTQKIRPITFDHNLADGRDDVVLAHLNHHLVQMCVRLLRAEIWALEGRKSLHRVTARVVDDNALDTPAVIAHARFVVLGGDNQRLHEEIITAGGRIRAGRFSRMNVSETKAALDGAVPDSVPDGMQAKLSALWPNLKDALSQSLEARMKDRTRDLTGFLAERASKEADDVKSILLELERSIKEELKESSDPQLTFDFSDDETDQFERNRASLQARLDAIPNEIEQETAAVKRRYADPSARIFPAAVTFFIPEGFLRKGGLD